MAKDTYTNIGLQVRLIKNLNIKKKMFLFLCVCIVIVLLLFSIIALMARKTVLETSKDSLVNLSSEFMHNLDSKISSLEMASSQMLKSFEEKGLLNEEKDISYYKYNERTESFKDIILLTDYLYDNVKAAHFENMNGFRLEYYNEKNKVKRYDEKSFLYMKAYVSTGCPYVWKVYEEKLLFMRMLVNETSLEPEGFIMLEMNNDFYNLIELENEILSNEYVCVFNKEDEMMKGTFAKAEILREIMEPFPRGTVFAEKIKLQQKNFLMLSADSQDSGWHILLFVPVSSLQWQHNTFVYQTLIILLILFVMVSSMSAYLEKTITKNVEILKEGMLIFEKEGRALCMHPYTYDDIGKLITNFNYMTFKIEQLNHSVLDERQKKERAEFQATLAKINPHFLYNTLGSIKWEARRSKHKNIEEMLDALIYLMRFSIKRTDTFITVEEELQYVKSYIALQKMRFGESFQAVFDIEKGVENAKVLGFILQPIIENALYHGIDMETEKGVIRIEIHKFQDILSIKIIDNGCGMTKKQIEAAMQQTKEYKGFNSIGVKIIADRLDAFYTGHHSMTIESVLQKGTVVTIEIPYEEWGCV